MMRITDQWWLCFDQENRDHKFSDAEWVAFWNYGKAPMQTVIFSFSKPSKIKQTKAKP